MKKLYLSLTCIAVSIAAGCSSIPQEPVAWDDSALNKSTMKPGLSVDSLNRRLTLSPEQLADFRSGAVMANLPSSPVVVDIRDIAATAAISEGYLAGGESIESPFSEAQKAQAVAAAQAKGPQSGVNVLPNGADNLAVNNNGKGKGNGKKGPKLRNVIDSIGAEDCCGSITSATVPPDSEMTAGKNHLIAAVNVSVEIYDKAGNVVVPAVQFGLGIPSGVIPFNACSPPYPFDPDVVYDEEAERYIIGYDGGGAFYCMAVSVDSDPFVYNIYWFDGSEGFDQFFDFPHMGVGADNIYIGSNNFDGTTSDCTGFCGVVHAVDKSYLYAGNSPAVPAVRQTFPRQDGTPQPANNHGVIEGTFPTSGPHYIMTEVFDGINHSVYAWDDPFGANNFYLVGDVDLAAASGVPCPGYSCYPVPVPQNDGGVLYLEGNDFRGQETQYRNGSLWTAQTISCNPGSGVVNCVRWAEVDPTAVVPGPTDGGGFLISASTNGVVQAGVFSADDGNHRFFPSLNVNRCGDMAIGYSKSGAGILPSVAITGRRRNDPAGFVRGEVDVIAGTEIYRSWQTGVTRWGDYSGMSIDPNGVDFWHIGEYSGPSDNIWTNWQNVISKSNFGCKNAGK